MDIAADNARQRSDVSPGLRTLRQQWRLGMGLLEPFDVPIAIGLRSGHVSSGNVTLPLGVEFELNLENDQPLLRNIEPAVATPKHAT